MKIRVTEKQAAAALGVKPGPKRKRREVSIETCPPCCECGKRPYTTYFHRDNGLTCRPCLEAAELIAGGFWPEI